MSKPKVSFFKKARASFCHHCPVCNHARKKPQSFIGKMLNHPSHANHCPFWKAEQEIYQ